MPPSPPRLDPSDRAAEVQRLLVELSTAEKIGMMSGSMPFWRGIVAMTRLDVYHRKPFAAGAVPRLGIEGIHFIDGPRGVVLEGGATTFPVPMARGATWDPELEERVGDAIGKELRSHGGNLFGGVCINLLRHPAWGRAQETYGEDHRHLGAMGSALVRGVQRHAMACIKHFALNSIENARFTVDVRASKRALHELYLPHFKDCVDSGAWVVMSAYNAANGEWCGQHRELLTETLKERWGFQGFVLTDFVFGLRDAEKGANAGQDLEMPFRMVFADSLPGLVASGAVPMDRIDDAVSRMLHGQLSIPPKSDYPMELRACKEHTELAREVAAKSMVLLENRDAILPIAAGTKVALVGRLAAVPNLGDRGSSDGRPEYVVTPLDGLRAALGDGVTHTDGSDIDATTSLVSAADVAVVVVGYTHAEEGEHVVPPDIKPFIPLVPLPRFLRAFLRWRPMQRLRAWIIEAVGERQRKRLASGKTVSGFGKGGDRTNLGLPADQVTLIRQVVAAQPNTVVAVMAGSAVLMEAWRREVPGLLMLWYPGMEGGHAFADVLMGKVNPSGRLPFSIPTSAEHLPHFDKDATAIEYDLWHGYRKLMRDGNAPAYPFGYGLSYTRFELSDLRLQHAEIDRTGSIEVAVRVENVGERDGAMVVQAYVGKEGSAVERAGLELQGFCRVEVPAGTSVEVNLSIAAERLGYFDEEADGLVAEPGPYRLFVGQHVADAAGLAGKLSIR